MQAWLHFLTLLESKLGKATVDRWLRSLKVTHFDARNLYLEALDPLCLNWFEEHIRPHLHSFVNSNHQPIHVHLKAIGSIVKAKPPTKKVNMPTAPDLVLRVDPLNPHCTFEEWVASPTNQVPFQLLGELRQRPVGSNTFNPIFYYGPPGSGKTHLLMATAHAFKTQGQNALYVEADTFTEHVVTAIRASSMQTFRSYYRHVDLLLIDNIHLLSRRLATQEEFFHTFNALHMSGKQMIFSSLHPPSLMEEIEPRLISRFEWGLVLPLKLPDRAELKEILHKKSLHRKCPLEANAIDWIIETFPPHPLAIQKALNTLILRRHLTQIPFDHAYTLPETTACLKELLLVEKASAITPHKIINAVAIHYDIRTEDLLSPSHRQEFAQPRQIAMYLCRLQLQLPFTKIGALFSRDHSTVMTSVKQVQQRLKHFDTDLASAIRSIEISLSSR